MSLTNGTASVAGSSQSNALSLNTIASSGALGTNTSPAGFSQTSGVTGTGISFGSSSMPSNSVQLGTYGGIGAGTNASASNLGQNASFNVNSLSGVGITGNATQVSNGQTSTIGNLVTAAAIPGFSSGGVTGLGAAGVSSGNATLSNVAQGAAQSLNTMALGGGAANGILNQATFGATLQSTGNAVTAIANRGYATVTGTQVASNAVNTIH
jgi:hypothetical protein